MMYGRGYYGYGNNGCFGYGLFNNGWSIIIGIGVFLIIALLIYFLVHNNKKGSNRASFESLKMKYVHGEITEEEYLKRKEVLDRK